MSSSTLVEVFRHIVFSFTRSVTEHYNKEEREFTADAFGYNPFECTGREWYYKPVEEYSDREATSVDYLASSRLNVRLSMPAHQRRTKTHRRISKMNSPQISSKLSF